MGKYNKYSDEFKKEAVGVSLTSAARDVTVLKLNQSFKAKRFNFV